MWSRVDVPFRELRGQLVWFLGWLGVVGFGLFLRPSHEGHGTHRQLGFPPCPSVALFGRPCPGCGMTTSWSALLHGDLGLAFSAHPLGPPSFLLFTASAAYALVGVATGRRIASSSRWFTRGTGVALGVFILFGAVRFLTVAEYGTPAERAVGALLR